MAARVRRKLTAEEKAAQGQLAFQSPIDQHAYLYLGRQQNDVILWHADIFKLPKEERARLKLAGQKAWEVLPPNKSYDGLAAVAGKYDKYITPNEFEEWRLLHKLRGLNAVYLDFDSHAKRMTQPELEQWHADVMAKINVLGWHVPTFSIMTGRGFHVYWLHHRVDPRALHRWQALIRHMCITLGADRMSVDCCREMRIIGTRNSKAAEGFIVHGYEHSGLTYEFEELYETICKPKKAEIREIEKARKARAERKAKEAKEVGEGDGLPASPKRTSNLFEWYHKIHRDLFKVAEYLSAQNGGHGIREGARTIVLELFCASLCWFREDLADVEYEVLHFARRFTPDLTPEQVLRDTRTLRKRAEKIADGEHKGKNQIQIYEGTAVDARYKYSRAKIWEKFAEEHVPEVLWPELEALVPPELAKERNAARKKERDAGRDRVIEGRYSARNTGEGHRDTNALKVALAREKKAAGASVASIARELKVSRPTVDRWLDSAAAASLETLCAQAA